MRSYGPFSFFFLLYKVWDIFLKTLTIYLVSISEILMKIVIKFCYYSLNLSFPIWENNRWSATHIAYNSFVMLWSIIPFALLTLYSIYSLILKQNLSKVLLFIFYFITCIDNICSSIPHILSLTFCIFSYKIYSSILIDSIIVSWEWKLFLNCLR